jgi:hypothetical protein
MYGIPPGEGAPVAATRVAYYSLAHAVNRAHAPSKVKLPEQRRRKHDRPFGARATTRWATVSAEVAGHEVVDADRKMRAVLLERARADDRERATPIRCVDGGAESSSRRSTVIAAVRVATARGGAAPSSTGRSGAALAVRGVARPRRSRAARKSVFARSQVDQDRSDARRGAAPPRCGG